jgi:tRNA (guanine-N7-)-methyltransferase
MAKPMFGRRPDPPKPRGYQDPAVEVELGVPIPGRILPEERWAKTALKRLPEGNWNCSELFGRAAPVTIDLGCGNGRSILQRALAHPEQNHLGVDILPVVIRYATRRANQRGLHHVRIAVIGGRELLDRHIEPASVAEIHCYHPQPYYTAEEIPKRLITPAFFRSVVNALIPGGRFFFQTDHPAYWKYTAAIAAEYFDWQEHPRGWPDSPEPRTRREIMAKRKGFKIFRGEGRARPIAEIDFDRLERELPRPTFEADRRLQELDKLEAGQPKGQRPSHKKRRQKKPAD